jgi:hypothetical protein
LSRHRHQEFLRFLKTIDEAIPEEEGVTIHVIMDNYATHKCQRAPKNRPLGGAPKPARGLL